jgi:hypothetical protein
MRWARRIYSVLCVTIAAACLWPHPDTLLATVAAFWVLTSLAVFRGGWPGRWLAGLSGVFLVMWAMAGFFLGWFGERGAVPLALGTGLAGALGLAIAVGGRSDREQTS